MVEISSFQLSFRCFALYLVYRISSNRSRGRSKDEYIARLVGLPGISFCSNKYKIKNLGVLNTCSLVNQVVLIEPGASIRGNTVSYSCCVLWIVCSLEFFVVTHVS